MRKLGVGQWQLLILVTALVLSACLAAVVRTPPSVARFDACLANLHKISLALEMYSTDHDGHYPRSLSDVVPKYLSEVPLCPSAGYDTYTSGFEQGKDSPHNRYGYQDFYYLSCSGHHHLDAAVNSPAFPNVGMGCMWRGEDQMRRAYGYLGHR